MIYAVFNARGACYYAKGDSEAEAIENARSMFASNVICLGPGWVVPDRLFAQVGMRAVLIDEGSI